MCPPPLRCLCGSRRRDPLHQCVGSSSPTSFFFSINLPRLIVCPPRAETFFLPLQGFSTELCHGRLVSLGGSVHPPCRHMDPATMLADTLAFQARLSWPTAIPSRRVSFSSAWPTACGDLAEKKVLDSKPLSTSHGSNRRRRLQ